MWAQQLPQCQSFVPSKWSFSIDGDGKTAISKETCTIYGSHIICCDKNSSYTWKISINKMSFSSDNICIGIDDAQMKYTNSQTLFANKDGYGYFDTGEVRANGTKKPTSGQNSNAKPFAAGDIIIMKLNIAAKTLVFHVNHEHGFQFNNIITNNAKKYRMAIGMRGKNSITLNDFIIEADEKTNNNNAKQIKSANKENFNNQEIVEQLLKTIEQQNKEITNLKQNNSLQKEKISALESQIKQRENKICRLEMETQQIDIIKQENIKLKKRANNLEDEQKEYEMRINELKKEIKTLKINSININEFKEWKEDEVLNWIFSIENRLFLKYEQKLNEEVRNCEIKGIDLLKVTRSDVKEFGVKTFADQKILMEHIEKLKQIEKQNDNKNFVEGNIAPTAYI